MGYSLYPGGHWTGDYYIIDAVTLEQADGIHGIKVKRVKDIIIPEYFTFPLKAGLIKQPETGNDVFVADLIADEDESAAIDEMLEGNNNDSQGSHSSCERNKVGSQDMSPAGDVPAVDGADVYAGILPVADYWSISGEFLT